VHRAAGAVPDAAGDAEEPWPAPAATPAAGRPESDAAAETGGSSTEPVDAAEETDGSDDTDREQVPSAQRDEVAAPV
jgi:hypothetical protein